MWQAFGGEGQVLGNPEPSVSQNTSTSSATPTDLASCEQKAKTELNVEENQPVTNLQVVIMQTLFLCCNQKFTISSSRYA